MDPAIYTIFGNLTHRNGLAFRIGSLANAWENGETALRWGIRVAAVLVFVMALFVAPSLSHARERAPGPNFDHFQTGFPLTGAHAGLSCASCHQDGSFTGTPKVCADCHNSVRASGKPARHIRTQAACDSCHTTRHWQIARF